MSFRVASTFLNIQNYNKSEGATLKLVPNTTTFKVIKNVTYLKSFKKIIVQNMKLKKRYLHIQLFK